MACKRHRERSSNRPRRVRSIAGAATNADSLRGLLHWLLPDATIFAKIRFHGNITWAAPSLVILALCWSLSEARHVTDAFTEAAGWCRVLLGSSPLTTYQGFMGALSRWTRALMPILISVLQYRMIQAGGKFARVDGWFPIGFDGSRSTAPRSKSNEDAFCAKNYGQGKTARYRKKKSKGMRRKQNQRNPAQPQGPQSWITMLWQMSLRLPWDWRLGPSNASERDHVMEMVEAGCFPDQTLLCGDAGFVGYRLWSCFQRAGVSFLVRVGGNVSLLSEHAVCTFEKTAKELHVLCWPKDSIRAHLPPLRLRLVRVRVGKTRMWLLTNVLDRQALTTKMMARFYAMRWGVEVEFRGLKQTLDRAKLRCRNSQRLLAELHWSIFAMAVAELWALKEQVEKHTAKTVRKRKPPYQPSKRSLANAMRAIRGGLRNLSHAPDPGAELAALLGNAVTDDYQRTRAKRARYRPPNPDKKPVGDPKIRRLNLQEKQTMKQLRLQNTA